MTRPSLRRMMRVWVLCVVAGNASALGQYRVDLSLNGKAATGIWTFRPVAAYDCDHGAAEARKRVSIPAGPITVPSFWSDSNPDWDDDWRPITSSRNKWIEQAEYSRRFDVPASMAGKRIKLHFGAVNHAAEVRVNGQMAGPRHYQGVVPLEYDITSLVSAPSTGNVLTVMVWDHNQLRDPHDRSKYAYPFGHAIWAHKMSGISQDVTLYAVPDLYVKDVYVITSVKAMTISLQITIANEDAAAHTVKVQNDFRRIARTSPTEEALPERSLRSSAPVTVPPGQEVVVTLSDTWPDATLWWPHAPQLYRLHTRLIEEGVTVDEKTDVRFGFREFTIDSATGNRYKLNGLPFRGRGANVNMLNRNLYGNREAMDYVIDTYKAFGAVLIRHGAAVPPPPLFWDICDEKGMLAIEELYYNGQNENEGGQPWQNGIMFYTLHYGDPAFERHVDAMARAIVTRDRNHPAIVRWSIENEVFYNLMSDQPTEKQKDDVARVRSVIESLDATRPIGCDHEGTLDGRLAVKNKHYPGKASDLNNDFRAKSWGDWYPSGQTDIYWPMRADPPSVPFGVGEFHWLKKASTDPNEMTYPYHWGRLRAYTVRGFRLVGMSDIRSFSYPHDALRIAHTGISTRNSHMINRKSLSAVAVFDHDYDARDVRLDWLSVDEGSSNTRRYDVYNDDIADTETAITVGWEVRWLDRVTDSGSQIVQVPLSESRDIKLTWTAPHVNEDTNFMVAVEAVKSGRQVFTDYRIFRAIDRGGPVVKAPNTFRDDFDGGPTKGFIEYDTFWRVKEGVYSQPETRGLFANAIPKRVESTGRWTWREDPYTLNAHMAAIHPWTFDDFRASFDVHITEFHPDYSDQWAGMGFRLAYPECSPFEHDRSRRSGCYVGVRRLQKSDTDRSGRSNWRLFIGRVDPTRKSLAFLASKVIPVPSGFVRVEATLMGPTIVAEACGVRITATDSTYRKGYASLVSSQRAAARYDNVQIGGASFAPIATAPAKASQGDPVVVTWTGETDAAEYSIEWSRDGFATVGGRSGWIAATQWTFSDLPVGAISLRVFSRDADGRQSVGSPVATTAVFAKGDLDLDLDVDLADFVRFAQAFGGQGKPVTDADADLDGDGDCDLADLRILAANVTGPQHTPGIDTPPVRSHE